MKRYIRISVPLILSAFIYLLFISFFNPSASRAKTTLVVQGPLAVWSSYAGRLEARNERLIFSRLRGNATLIELAPDGSRIAKGGVLARFESSLPEREILRLERDRSLAGSELDNLVNAKIPLELRELQISLMEASSTLKAEERYADALARFLKEGLVSEAEIAQHKSKVGEAETKLATLELQLKLTREHKHPSELKSAQAKLAAAEQELRLAGEQLANSALKAPSSGVVVHRTVHVGEGFRTVRVGDSVFPNQPFMALPDMGDMVVHCDVPEEDLSLVREGKEAFLQPLAFAGIKLRGVVESVGSAAQNLPNEPGWRKFFHVVIGLKEADPRLKPGMSVTAQVLSHFAPQAVKVPRVAVRWEEDKPWVSVLAGSSTEIRQPKLGKADDEYYEVLQGLKPGDKVVLR